MLRSRAYRIGRATVAGWLATGLWGGLATATARAQMGAMGRSLGGYGAVTISSYYTTGGGGAYLPYAGRGGGFVPYRALEPMRASMGPRRIAETPIGGASLMLDPRGGRMAGGRAPTPLPDRAGLGMRDLVSPTRRPDRRPTLGFGSPFREPPGLIGGAGMGPSM